MTTFDPAAHLHKQGWKGKGTALRQGHATRPLAVVQKKNLGGIGKDRDEAVPFWDQIFAATAASIFTPTTSPSPAGSGSSTPIPLNSAHTSTRSWTTTTFGSAPKVAPRMDGGVSTAARVNKEQARKGLYSRFFKGKVVEFEPDNEDEDEVKGDNGERPVAGSSSSSIITSNKTASADATEGVVDGDQTSKSSRKGKGKEREGETKEEKLARRAEKSKRKSEKEARRALKASTANDDLGEMNEEVEGKSKRKRKLHAEGDTIAAGGDVKTKSKRIKPEKDEGETVGKGKAEKRMKKDKKKEEKRKKEEKAEIAT